LSIDTIEKYVVDLIKSEKAIVAAEALTLRNGWMVRTKGKREESKMKGGKCENGNCLTPEEFSF